MYKNYPSDEIKVLVWSDPLRVNFVIIVNLSNVAKSFGLLFLQIQKKSFISSSLVFLYMKPPL